MDPSHTTYMVKNDGDTCITAQRDSSTFTKLYTIVPWASWIPGNLSSIISNTGSAVTRMASTVMYGRTETENINASILGTLSSCNARLDELRRKRLELETEYQSAVLTTKNIESIYKNNLNFINKKIDDIRVNMIRTVDAMSGCLDPLRVAGVSNNEVIDVYNSVSTLVEKLKEHAGTQFSHMFPHINMDGVKVAVDYSTAIAMNKTILQEIAVSREKEAPTLKKLEETRREIYQLEKEVDLVREFQINHSRLISDKVHVPMVSENPVPLVDDTHNIRERTNDIS